MFWAEKIYKSLAYGITLSATQSESALGFKKMFAFVMGRCEQLFKVHLHYAKAEKIKEKNDEGQSKVSHFVTAFVLVSTAFYTVRFRFRIRCRAM